MSKLIKLFTLKNMLIVIIASFIVVISIMILTNLKYNSANDRNATKVAIRTDKEPIIKRFPTVGSFQSCYWKTNTIGRTNFGPTSYWMKGFIVLHESTFKDLKSKYSWTPVDIRFSTGIDATVTGFTTFNWCCNKDFVNETKTASFIGEFYLDIQNGVIYFDVENN